MHQIGYVATSDKEEAEEIGQKLLDERLVACVNYLGKIKSKYWWKNQIRENNEFLLIFKTIEENTDEIIKKIKKIHSYDNPSIVFLDINSGSEEYLKWISRYTKK